MTNNKTLILAGAAILYFATKASACSPEWKPVEDWNPCNIDGKQTRIVIDGCGNFNTETKACTSYPPINGYAAPDGTTPSRTSVIHTVNNIPLIIVNFAGIDAVYGPIYNLAWRDYPKTISYTSTYDYLKLVNVEKCDSYKLRKNIGTISTANQMYQSKQDYYDGIIDHDCYVEIMNSYFNQ